MELHGYASETVHLQQSQMVGPFDPTQSAYVGYIAEVDIENHAVTVIDPLNSNLDTDLANPNDPVHPTKSAFMPLITGFASLSNGKNPIRDDLPCPYGMQVVPFGGGATANPQAGEQVVVVHLNADIGAGAVAFYCYNDQAKPPGSQNIPVSGAQLSNGEWLYVTPAGTIIHLDKLANFNLYTLPVPDATTDSTANITAISQGGISIQATATPGLTNPIQYTINANADLSVNLAAGVTMNLTAPSIQIRGSVVDVGNSTTPTLSLITAAMLIWLGSHTHEGVQSGLETSGPPVLPPPATYPYVTASTMAN